MERITPKIVIFMILGIIIADNFINDNIYIFLISMFIFLIVILIKIITEDKKIVYLSTFYLLGVFLVLINNFNNEFSNYIDKPIKIYGEIDKVRNNNNYYFKVLNTNFKNQKNIIGKKVNLKIYDEYKFDLGDKLVLNMKLNKPRENTNPKLFNNKVFLKSKNIYLSSTIKYKDIIKHDNQNIKRSYKIKRRFIRFIDDTLNKYLKKQNADLISSIILGDTSFLDIDILESYRKLGLAHILAVSGLHIGIISGFIIFVLSNIGIKREYVYSFVLLFLWIYAYLIGFPVSIIRANIMLSILYLSRIVHEPQDMLNSLGVSAFILLIINPYYIYSLSFQLSFGAVLSLAIILPKLKEYIYPVENFIIDSLLAIISVQVGLLPLQIYYFNYISIIGILANLIIVPLISIALILSFLLIVIEIIFMPLGFIVAIPLNIILMVENIIFKFINKFVYLNINLFSPDIFEMLGYYLIISFLIYIDSIRKINKKIINYLGFINIFAIIILLLNNLIFDDMELHFIDVGQGDSILIKSNRKNYLIDTGGEIFGDFSIGKNITTPYLIKHNVNKLDAVFISHFHDDHCKGLMDIKEEINIENIFISYKNDDNYVYNEIKKFNNLKILEKGDLLKLDKNINAKVLSPDKTFIDKSFSENDLSMVLEINFNGIKVLFTGDMEEKVERYLDEENLLNSIDILKVPHHGSKTSSTENLLKNINPKDAIFMIGKNNNFGHPNLEVLKRYRNKGVNIYRTDDMGRILVNIRKNYYNIEPFINSPIKIYNIFLYFFSVFISTIMIIYDIENKERLF